MKVCRWTRWGVTGLFFVLPVQAAAQPPAAPSRVSVGAGVGAAFLVSANSDFTPLVWEADISVALAPKVRIEGSVSEARHSRVVAVSNLPGSHLGGVIGRLEQRTTYVLRSWQVNLLATGTAGRVRLSGGGGAGLLESRRRTRTTTSECTPGEPCGTQETAVSTVSGTVQGVGDVEVRIVGRLAGFGRVGLIVPTRDAGSSEVRVTAGVRWRW